MPRKLLLSEVGGEPSGFVLAVLCAILALVAAAFIAIALPGLKSFRDIATPSAIAIGFALVGAFSAVLTSHAIDRDEESEGPQTRT